MAFFSTSRAYCLLVLIVAFAQARRITTSNFSFLGSYTGPQEGGISVRDFDPHNYYVSTTAAEWLVGRQDCKAQLGGDLLSISSREEADFIAEQLDRYGSGVNYWTAGQMQTQTFSFWANNGQLLPIWLTWYPGHPPNNTNPLHRVKINHINTFFSFYEVETGTIPLRYICKV